MAFINVELSFKIFDSYSLKDKRSIVKSIIARMHQRYPASLAEIGDLDMLNVATIGIAVVNQSAVVAQQVLDNILKEMEEHYEIEIFQVEHF